MSSRLAPLTKLKTYDSETGDLVVIVETPKNSRSKYQYDEASGAFALKFVLPQGMSFPVDFGFLPSTLGGDGDPLDVVLLLDESLAVGTKVRARLLGAITAEEREKNGKWERNDRLIAVATHAHAGAQFNSLVDLDAGFIDGLERFFEDYNRQHGKEFKVNERVGAADATLLVKKGMKAFAK